MAANLWLCESALCRPSLASWRPLAVGQACYKLLRKRARRAHCYPGVRRAKRAADDSADDNQELEDPISAGHRQVAAKLIGGHSAAQLVRGVSEARLTDRPIGGRVSPSAANTVQTFALCCDLSRPQAGELARPRLLAATIRANPAHNKGGAH